MTHFDTLAYARALKGAGVPEQQAEAHAEALRDIVSDEVATKIDIASVKTDLAAVEANLKTDIAELKGEVNLLKWMMGFVLAMLAALLWLTIRAAV